MFTQQATAGRAKARVGSIVKEKWRLDALLGIGGTASVYAATHRNGKRAAIKMLHPELAAIDQLVSRFLREGYVANKIEHPGAVSVLDDDRADDGSVFLVMELLDGHSLERHTRQTGEAMGFHRVLRVANDILDVLAAAHAKGIIHRDIKPANIFLTRDGHVKVLDFGIARLAEPLADGSVTQAGAAIGTPAFMPQEQARGRWDLVDARTDVWAVGATMFALLTGERLRKAETVQEELLLAMTQPVSSIRSVLPQAPPDVATIIDRALAFDMGARWPDARAMQAAIRAVLDASRGRADGPPMANPVTPQLDTAPVLVQGSVEPADTQLTTGRPLMWAAPPEPPARTAKRGLVMTFLAAFALSVAAFVVVLVVMAQREPQATTSRAAAPPPEPVVATTLTAAPTPAPPATTAAAPAEPRSAETATLSSASASAAPIASASAPARAPAKPIAPRPPPAKNDPNPFDQRF